MNKDGGFIKLYRSMLKWEWHDDPNTVATWLYCLMRANYATTKWHGEIIRAGQFLTSLDHMAKEIGITVNQLRTAIKHLKATHNITSQSTSKGTLLTVENWALYQSAGEKVTSQSTNIVTFKSQADNKPTTTDKKYIEDIESKERESIERDAFSTATYKGKYKYSQGETDELMKTAHEEWLKVKGGLS